MQARGGTGMWKVPKRYRARCTNGSGKEIFNKEIEAINLEEAKSRAFINCLIISGRDKEFKISVSPF